MTFKKYKKNLKVEGAYVISYDTMVAEINHVTRTVHPQGVWSITTTKHINYVAKELGYGIVKIIVNGTPV